MSKQKKAKLFSFGNLLYDVIRILGALPGLVWLRPKICYTSKKAKRRIRGGALVISNHNGFIDPVFTMYAIWYRRQKFVCHRVFLESKAGPLMRAVGCCIPIDADNMHIGSFREITDALKNGHPVVLFPEGHINDGSGKMRAFKSGMALIAMQSRRPIVPIYLKPRKHWYSRLKAVIDEPVDLTESDGGMPAFSKIEETTRLLQSREEYLADLAEKI